MDIEYLARHIHEVYCRYCIEVKGEEYWTKGDYDLLDEEVKEADRYMARFILANFDRKDSSRKPLIANVIKATTGVDADGR